MHTNTFSLGLVTGICGGIIVALAIGTLAFNMHLKQMRDMRMAHEAQEVLQQCNQKD